MNKTTQFSDSNHKTWTDTHYALTPDDWLFSAKTTYEDGEEGVALNCPGYSRDGKGFVIVFQVEHLEAIHSLLSELQLLKAEQIRSRK
ncbi:MAG: hypothetical protein F6K23_36835 [Okeania sp. SIO2C9]|uniref:hypothetical protein n=1 Tax=Okeania sp. SIO2C9 TaxID=2607791 RepID=UPI0013BF1386|nr:hypothetical protein [Okeania sp. SIO2C9]NEQ78077.1 hypothetical protein [Okeania sp. SIO2C9]